MAQLLTLSRAARLVGISRGALQKRIKDGDLTTFEGKIAATDLLRLYPETRLEEEGELRRVTHIKDTAFGRRVRERMLPDAETLAARVQVIGVELAKARMLAEHYGGVLEQLRERLDELRARAPSAALQEVTQWLENALQRTLSANENPLLARDSLLRLMAAHVRNQNTGHEFFVEGVDTILDAGLSAGLALNYGCSDGSCGRCKARVLSGKIKAVRAANRELTAAEREQGYALLCTHTAVTDLHIAAEEALAPGDIAPQTGSARVKSLEHVPPGMTLLHLKTPPQLRLRWLAGQRFRLHFADGSVADVPAAGCPCDDRNLYFHLMSAPKTAVDDAVAIEGPHGDFVLDLRSARPLLFLAADAGFAPIKGLIEHAMALEAAEYMHLYWVAGTGGHYLHNLCRSWADGLDNFSYTPLTRGSASDDAGLLSRIREDVADLAEFDVYAAGPAAWTQNLQQELQRNGVPIAQLHVYETA